MKSLSMFVASILAALVFGGCSETSMQVADDAPPTPPAVADAAPSAGKTSLEKWQEANALLDRCNADSMAAIEKRLAEVDAFINERKARVPGYVREILGSKAKLAGGLVEQSINAVGQAFGQGKAFPEDSFRQYAWDTFRARVLGPSEVVDEIQSVIKGWQNDWRSLDSRLLVELKADLDQSPEHYNQADFDLLVKSQGEAIDSIVSHSVDAACNDLAQGTADAAISWVASEVITNLIVSKDDSTASKLAVNVGVGIGVDQAIGSLRGPDAEIRLIASVNAALDRMAAEIKEGWKTKAGLRGNLRIQLYNNIRMRRRTLYRFITGKPYIEIV